MFSSTWLTRKMMVMNWQCSYSEISWRGTLIVGNADRQTSYKFDHRGSVGNMWSTSKATQVDSNTNTGALMSETKLPQNLTRRKKMICIYYSGQHWSDECQTFSTVTATKEKIKGHCFIYLSQTRSPILRWEKLYREEGVCLSQTKKSSP